MKKNLKQISGVLILDKPQGITSNRALQIVKRLLSAKKAGHAGSLDPLATGVLPILFGEGTKFSQFLLDANKRYIVKAKLGEKTDTADSEGEVIQTRPVPVLDTSTILSCLEGFKGKTQQVPSMFSALKHQGQPLYKLARKGIVVERPARSIHIYELRLLNFDHEMLELEVYCSKGTYVRTLIDDIGEQLGCGAHVTALRRTQAGPFDIQQAVSLDLLQEIATKHPHTENLDDVLLPLYSMTTQWPLLEVSSSAMFYLKHGQPVSVVNPPHPGQVALSSPHQEFLGVGEVLADGRIAPKRMLQQPEQIDVAEG